MNALEKIENLSYSYKRSDLNISIISITKMSRLNFILRNDFTIEWYSSENMDYEISPDKFINKDMRFVLNLDEPYKTRVIKAFKKAKQSNITVEVKYVLKEIEYIAEITPLCKIEMNKCYYIKVICSAEKSK